MHTTKRTQHENDVAAYLARGGKISICPTRVGGYTQAERSALFSGRKTAEQIAAEKAEKIFGKKA
jgi:hypothetical protein